MTLNAGIQNRDRTLISDTIDRRIKHKIYITESNARKLLDWADSFSKMALIMKKEIQSQKGIRKYAPLLKDLIVKLEKAKQRNFPDVQPTWKKTASTTRYKTETSSTQSTETSTSDTKKATKKRTKKQ